MNKSTAPSLMQDQEAVPGRFTNPMWTEKRVFKQTMIGQIGLKSVHHYLHTLCICTTPCPFVAAQLHQLQTLLICNVVE